MARNSVLFSSHNTKIFPAIFILLLGFNSSLFSLPVSKPSGPVWIRSEYNHVPVLGEAILVKIIIRPTHLEAQGLHVRAKLSSGMQWLRGSQEQSYPDPISFKKEYIYEFSVSPIKKGKQTVVLTIVLTENNIEQTKTEVLNFLVR